MHGIFFDVVNEAIGARLGIPLVHQGYPWMRAQKMVRDGKADAFITVSTPERQTYTNTSIEPVIIMTSILFVKVGNPKIEQIRNSIKTLEDLTKERQVNEKITIGTYLGNGWAKRNFSCIHVDWSPSMELTLKKLVRGRFDIYIGEAETTWRTIEQLGLQNQILEIDNVIDQGFFLLHIGKQSPYAHILPKFDKIIRAMRKDGSLKAI